MIRKIILILSMFIFSSVLYAASPSMSLPFSKTGLSMKYYKGKKASGLLFGWHHVTYSSKNFFMGGAVSFGQIGNTSQSGSLSYGGVISGFTIRKKRVGMHMSILAGGGGGKLVGTNDAEGNFEISNGGAVVEPSVGVSFYSGKVVDFNVTASYVTMINTQLFSGYAVTLNYYFSLYK